MDSAEGNQEIWDNKNVPKNQIDLMSLSRIYYFFGYETPKGIKKPKGPWILVTIDLYSRYIDLEYIGNSATIENIIKHLKITFHKIGKPKILEADHQFNTKLFRDFLNIQGIEPYFFKGQETNKNAVVESNIKTVKNLILKYIYNFGIPRSIQMMLDIVTEEFNNHYHKGIKTTPYKAFHGYDDSHQEINIKTYPVIPNGTIVLRKPQPPRPGPVIYGRSLDIDPEPFRVIARTGNMVGLYQIQSLITGKIERKWYKPYELHTSSL
jgi:hypothetical protein